MIVLPHHLEAERTILSACLLFPDLYPRIAAVAHPDHFHDLGSRTAYLAIGAIFRRGEPLNVVTLEAELRARAELKVVGGVAGLHRLTDRYQSAQDAVALARRVRDLATARDFVIACGDIASEGEAALADPATWLTEVQGRLVHKMTRQLGPSVRTLYDQMGDVWTRLLDRFKGKPIHAIKTGFRAVDKYLDGGLMPGEYVIIGARPSMGKTALGLNLIARNCVMREGELMLPPAQRPRKQPGFLFSAEMKGLPVGQRLAAHMAGIDLSKIKNARDRDGRMMTDGEFLRFKRMMDRVHPDVCDVLLDDGAAMTVEEIEAKAFGWRLDRRRFPEGDESQIGIILVDYLGLIKAPRQIIVREQQVAHVSAGLKNLAKTTNSVVVALCQLNRAVDGRDDHEPTLSDLRESGATEQDADVVLFPFRESRYLKKGNPDALQAEHKARMILGKARNAQIGAVDVYWDGATQTFRDLEAA